MGKRNPDIFQAKQSYVLAKQRAKSDQKSLDGQRVGWGGASWKMTARSKQASEAGGSRAVRMETHEAARVYHQVATDCRPSDTQR